jgi:hypothetical protein
MNDVFQQHLAMGKVDEALKLFSRGIREYCTSANVLIEMLLNWITATIYAEQWSKLSILIPQAERAVAEAVDRDVSASSNQGPQRAAMPGGPSKGARSIKELVAFATAKISAISGLHAMKCGHFKTAAEKFISVS